MGYRSDVAYVVSFSSHKEPEVAFAQYLQFKKWVQDKHVLVMEAKAGAMTESYNYEAACRYSELKFYDSECMMIFNAQDVKWYDGYIEVEWHREVMKEISNNTDDRWSKGAWRFVRVGEEYTDIEVEEDGANHNDSDQVHNLWEYIEVHRSVSIDPPSHETKDKEAA